MFQSQCRNYFQPCFSRQTADSEVLDILLALREVPITIDILRETKIGNSVYEAKKKFPAGSKCHIESKDIIALWKKSCDVQASTSKPSTNSGATNDDEAKAKLSESAEKSSPTIAHSDSADIDDDGEVERNYDSLSSTRRKVTSMNYIKPPTLNLLSIYDNS